MLEQQRYNQPNRELHIFWIARPILPSVHAQSIIRASFFLASISCHPSTNSPMYPTIVFLSSAYPSHLNRKCSSFSTSPMVHCLQILSSFFNPFHLPVSTLNSAVPPLNLASILRILLLPTSTHRDWHPHSNSPFTTPNFDRSWISASQASLTILHALSLSICLISPDESLLMSSTLTPFHPNSPRLCSRSRSHFTLPLISIASNITDLISLLSPILKTFNQKSIHLLLASHLRGSIFISKRRATFGCSLPTPRIIL